MEANMIKSLKHKISIMKGFSASSATQILQALGAAKLDEAYKCEISEAVDARLCGGCLVSAPKQKLQPQLLQQQLLYLTQEKLT